MNNLKFPCVVLEGVTSQQEMQYLQKSYSKDSETGLPFYMTAFDKFKELGTIELNVNSVLNLNYISADYKIWLYKSPVDKVHLDQNDDNTLIKLIKL